MQAGDFGEIDGSNQVIIFLQLHVMQDQNFEYDVDVKN